MNVSPSLCMIECTDFYYVLSQSIMSHDGKCRNDMVVFYTLQKHHFSLPFEQIQPSVLIVCISVRAVTLGRNTLHIVESSKSFMYVTSASCVLPMYYLNIANYVQIYHETVLKTSPQWLSKPENNFL